MASWYEPKTTRDLRFADMVCFILDLFLLCAGVVIFAFIILGWNWVLNG